VKIDPLHQGDDIRDQEEVLNRFLLILETTKWKIEGYVPHIQIEKNQESRVYHMMVANLKMPNRLIFANPRESPEMVWIATYVTLEEEIELISLLKEYTYVFA